MADKIRKMPSAKAIRAHWAEKLVELGKFDSVKEVMEADYCFACGFQGECERAHIVPRCKGGTDSVENLHLLCNTCHWVSERFEDEASYWAWFREWDGLCRFILEGCCRPGVLRSLMRALNSADARMIDADGKN